MTASNPPFDGMANTKETAILSAVAEAVAWKNEALEPEDPPRKGQRVVIYPKDLVQLDAVLSTGDPNVDSESGHPIAYERILAHLPLSRIHRSSSKRMLIVLPPIRS
jgi:hypothetical protein